MVYEITKLPQEVLRAPTKKVSAFNDELKKLVADMRETMHAADGIGLAATQIDKSLKLAVLEYDPKRNGEDSSETPHIPFLAVINPKITHYSDEYEVYEEGCLSIPGLQMNVPRAYEVHVLTQDLEGNRVRIRARGLQARILQHEIDHLNGTLIIDRTTDRKIAKQFSDKSKVKSQKSK